MYHDKRGVVVAVFRYSTVTESKNAIASHAGVGVK